MRLRLFPVAAQTALALLTLLFQATPLQAQDKPAVAASQIDKPAMVSPKDPTDALTARVMGQWMPMYHFSKHPFDETISSKFFDRYIDSLDDFHFYFLQSDINEFQQYRSNLCALILQDQGPDISPCFTIFSRFMQRANARMGYVTNYLAGTTMDFSGHDRFTPDRHLLDYPKDEAQEKDFWREEARCEYLDALLKQPDAAYENQLETNASGATATFKVTVNHPASLALLPAKFYAKDGRELGSVEWNAAQSNAVAHFEWKVNAARKETNTIYSKEGEELGDIVTRVQAAPKLDDAHTIVHNLSESEAAFLSNKVAEINRNSNAVTTTNNGAAPIVAANSEGELRVVDTNSLVVAIHLKRKDLEAVRKSVIKRYADMLKNLRSLNADRVFAIYMNALAHAYDPHSDYMAHLEGENFRIQMSLSLTGIGAVIGTEDDGYCKIQELKQGPAMRSKKIKANDRIEAVAQSNAEPVNVVGMPVDDVVQLIRGPLGTKVTLTLIPADAPDSAPRKIVTLVRDVIKLEDSSARAKLYETTAPGGQPMKLGVIDLPLFYGEGDQTTSLDVARLLNRLKLEGANGVILDIRRNGGGFLEEAERLTGLFTGSGPVVQTKDWEGITVTEPSHIRSPLYKGPLIVLTSRLSASASEILAGALQDYGRALIVGDKTTFGKGTVQTVLALTNFFAAQGLRYSFDVGDLKITIKKFYRAGGASTQLDGVASDVVLPDVLNYADVGESSLPNAMAYDTNSSAEFEPLNLVQPYLSELRARSSQRVAADPEFAYIQEKIDRYKKDIADKSLSLNEPERLADQKQLAARDDEMKKERAARKLPPEKIFDITLTNTTMTVMTPVTPKTNSVSSVTAPGNDEEDLAQDTGDVDPTLEETKRILMDYVQLLGKGPSITKADGATTSPEKASDQGAGGAAQMAPNSR